MGFRIAIGKCGCRENVKPELIPICNSLLARLDTIRNYRRETLINFPESDDENVRINGKTVQFVTYRQNLPDKKILIVVQAFVETLRWPTFLSFNGIGHIIAEGFVFDETGNIENASDELLWEYR